MKRLIRIVFVFLFGFSLINNPIIVNAQLAELPVEMTRSIELDRAGISSPMGLTFNFSENAFIVFDKGNGAPASSSPISLTKIQLFEKEWNGSILFQTEYHDIQQFVFDDETQTAYFFDAKSRSLFQVQMRNGEWRAPQSVSADRIGVSAIAGMAIDPEDHTLQVLDSSRQQVVQLAVEQFRDSLNEHILSRKNINAFNLNKVKAITINPVTNRLFLVTSKPEKLTELDENGEIDKVWDLSTLQIRNPIGIVFAPTGDPTDDPSNLAVNILDAGSSNSSSARILEISLEAPEIEPLAETLPVAIVNSVPLSAWNPPSPDSSGIAYWPVTGGLLISDSEVDELPIFAGKNVFSSTLTGVLTATCTTLPFSYEPTGAAINPANGHLFFSNDDSGRVYEINLGPDMQYCTADDTVTSISTRLFNSYDPEGVAFGEGKLLIADGEGREVYIVSPGFNTVFDGVAPDGDDQVTNFDTYIYSMNDPEGIEYNPDRGTINLVGNYAVKAIIETDFSGNLLTNYDLTSLPTTVRSGLAYGPASNGSGQKHFYLVSRGVDNGTDPNENDGMLYEIDTFQTVPSPTPSQALPPTNTFTPGQTQTITPTLTFTRTPTATSTRTSTATQTLTPLPNLAPQVDAGSNLWLVLPQSAVLDGTANDDGRPDPPNQLSITWSKVSGPGTVTFGDVNAVDTSASFSQAGTYVLQLSAFDGVLTSVDSVTVVVMAYGVNSVLETRIATGNDDAEESAAGVVNRTSSTLELVYDTSLQTVGLYFSGLNIPPGVKITSAYIQFRTAKKSTTATSLIIQSQAAASPVSFAATARNISSRPRSAASASWLPAAWNIVGETGINQRTSDLSAVVQEVVNQPGWAIGNPAVFIITGSGKRIARSYNSDVNGAALLHIEFQPAGTVPTPTLTSAATQTFTVTPSATTNYTRTPSATPTVTLTATNTFTPTPLATTTTTSSPIPSFTPTHTSTASETPAATLTPTVTMATSLTPTFTQIPTETSTSTSTPTASLIPSLTSTSTITPTFTPTFTFTPTKTFTSTSVNTATFTPTTIPTNTAPGVSAGVDQTIFLPNTAALDGTVSDDGLPLSPGYLTTIWSQVSGPGTATFDNASLVDTIAHFSATGSYVLRLSASDGEFTSEDLVAILVGRVITYEAKIVDRYDEAEEFANGWIYTSSTDLELVYDSSLQTVGLRFRSLPVPKGAVINNAYIQFTTESASSEATSLNIKAQAADNAAAFGSTAYNVSLRPVGTAVTTWQPVPWVTAGQTGEDQRTPNLSGVITEVVNRPGWVSGNSIVFVITGTGRRVAVSYYGSAVNAPLLHIEYVSYQ